MQSTHQSPNTTPVSDYTDEQLRVINHQGGHAKVSAVAGSGKTTTLIGRIQGLLSEGVPAKRIIALMFNRSARNHFYSKLRLELHGAPTPRVQTFHGFGLALVESLVKRGALPESEIISSPGRYTQNLTHALRCATTHYPAASTIDRFALFEHQVKSDTASPEEKLQQLNSERKRINQPPYPDYFLPAFLSFEQQRKAQRIRFFSDLIYDAALAFRDNPELSRWAANRFDHILIDECQDINSIQQYIVKIIVGRRATLMLVGDVDQAIYAWNGATPDYLISGFQNAYPNVTSYKLSCSFRFGHTLSLAANNCITQNRVRDDIYCLSSSTAPNTQVKIIQHETQESPLCGILRYWQGSGNPLRDCLVLVRTNASTIPIEFALLGVEIPYHIRGAQTVFSRTEVRALLGYLRLISGSLHQHPSAATIIREMLSFPRLQLREKLINSLVSGLTTGHSAVESIAPIRQQIATPQQQNFLDEYAKAWDNVATISRNTSISDALESIVTELQLELSIRKRSSDAMENSDQQRLIDGLLSFAKCWPNSSITAFLDFCDEQALFNLRSEENKEFRPRRDAVQIATVHKVKGLESPLVIVTDLKDGLFPLNTHCNDPELLDSERRLFYVAITRASRRLYCLCPKDPDLDKPKNRNSVQNHVASRFVHEMQVRASQTIGIALHAGNTPKVTGRLLSDYVSRVESDPKQISNGTNEQRLSSTHADHTCTTLHNDMVDGTPVTGGTLDKNIWMQMPVRHGAFGNGIITRIRHSQELGTFIDVQFDSGKRVSTPPTHIKLTYRAGH